MQIRSRILVLSTKSDEGNAIKYIYSRIKINHLKLKISMHLEFNLIQIKLFNVRHSHFVYKKVMKKSTKKNKKNNKSL